MQGICTRRPGTLLEPAKQRLAADRDLYNQGFRRNFRTCTIGRADIPTKMEYISFGAKRDFTGILFDYSSVLLSLRNIL